MIFIYIRMSYWEGVFSQTYDTLWGTAGHIPARATTALLTLANIVALNLQLWAPFEEAFSVGGMDVKWGYWWRGEGCLCKWHGGRCGRWGNVCLYSVYSCRSSIGGMVRTLWRKSGLLWTDLVAYIVTVLHQSDISYTTTPGLGHSLSTVFYHFSTSSTPLASLLYSKFHITLFIPTTEVQYLHLRTFRPNTTKYFEEKM